MAIEVARDAGALLRARLTQPRDVQHKGTVDLVTDADRAAEALIASRLRKAFPDHRLIGEEGARGASGTGESPGDAPYGWIIDPLDGTTNYAHGFPHFCVSIGLEHAGAFFLGVAFDPMRDELFVAERGGGATCNGVPLHVSRTNELIGTILTTGFSYDLSRRPDQAAVWRSFLTRVQAIRQTGSAALNLCYVAAGRIDGYWEQTVQPWDTAAGALMVLEAGGKITDYAGSPYRPYGREIVASNGAIHPAMLDTIASPA